MVTTGGLRMRSRFEEIIFTIEELDPMVENGIRIDQEEIDLLEGARLHDRNRQPARELSRSAAALSRLSGGDHLPLPGLADAALTVDQALGPSLGPIDLPRRAPRRAFSPTRLNLPHPLQRHGSGPVQRQPGHAGSACNVPLAQ
jgi:hypothetical protein